MNKRNIYKMDDILLFLSLAMLALVVFISLDWLRLFKEAEDFTAFILMAPEVLGPRLYTVIMYALAALTAQIIGRYIRFLEKKSLIILDELEKSSKIRLSELRMKLGMSEAKIKKLVIKLSKVSSLGIELDGDKVIQKRVSIYESNTPETTTEQNLEKEFHNDMPQDMSEDMAEAIKKGELPEQFKSLLKSGNPLSGSAGVSADNDDGSKKKGPPLLLLIFLFFTPLWPVAVVLIFRSSMKNMQRKNEEA